MLGSLVEHPLHHAWLPLALRIQSPEAKDQGKPPNPTELERLKLSLGQQEFSFE